MSTKLGQEPAFPFIEKVVDVYGGESENVTLGMSKRLVIAKDILSGLLSNPDFQRTLHRMVKEGDEQIKTSVTAAYQYADELLKQEND